MGKVETEARQRRKKQDVQKAVLASVGIAGMLAVAVIAPNALQLLRYVPGNKDQLGYRARTAATRLAKKGLISFTKKNGVSYARLTKEGEKALAFEQAKHVLTDTKKKRRWDGQWRMVVFDIPERRRAVRFRLRGVMREIGFMRLQDSVWVYPYDCEDFIVLLKAELKTGKDILYAVVAEIERDHKIREHFKLPPRI
jgi:DNA-binding transcriptional regulator PaaX